MLSFMEARGGGTSLLSSTLMAPVGILFKHYKHIVLYMFNSGWNQQSHLPGE